MIAGNGHAGPTLTLTGVDGTFRYDRVDLKIGQSVVVGRSRSCELSLRRSKVFLAADEEEQRRLLDDKLFLKVSRRHVQVTYLAEGHVEIWNLSKNGTWVTGARIDRLLLPESPADGVESRLAETETLRLVPR